MTIDPLCLHPTDSIAYPEKFYPADVEVSHPQLRNFISTVYEDKIFYVNRYDIYILDLETNQRALLVTVPFEARCLAAAHGWVCVGGETKGDCAFIYIGEEDGQPGTFCHELLVEMLGKEIVNSMTVQLLKPEIEGYRDEVVVLISNNDRTVTIYSLTQRLILATIEHPQPMNHAVLCPDSTILAAVGDENKVYFMERILDSDEDEDESETSSRELRYANYNWVPLAAPDVPRGVFEADDFSFSVAFSPDGRLCAASSQGGAITIFDMEFLAERPNPVEDAIVCSFRSSRESLWGCVRSMAFSPAPWNLLAWAEDHGRIGLADVRQGFLRRQIIELSRDKVKDVEPADATPHEWRSLDVKERLQRQHQQRMQALRGHPPLGARSLSHNQRRSSIDEPFTALSHRERSIIDSLESTIDEIETPRNVYSINYASNRVRPSASSIDARREYEVQLLNPGSRFLSSHGPRRRSSVVLSESQSGRHLAVDESTRMTMTASPGPMSDDGTQVSTSNELRLASIDTAGSLPPLMSTNDLTPASAASSSQPLPYNIPLSDPWHVIEASLATGRVRRESVSRPNSGLLQVESAIFAERQLAIRLERQLADEQRLSALLRSEIEARERLLETRHHELQSNRPTEGDLTPSLELLHQRQLQSERDHALRRTEELETEIRDIAMQVEMLRDERNSLVPRRHEPLIRADSHRDTTSSTPRTSALPTTPAQHDHDEQSRRDERIQMLDENRRIRAQRLQDLERQSRRAESRLELATLQNDIEHTRARTRALADGRTETTPSTLSLVNRQLPTPSPTSASTGSPVSHGGIGSEARSLLDSFDNIPSLSPNALRRQRTRQPTQAELSSASRNRVTIPRISELATTSTNSGSSLPTAMRIPDNDLRIARLMLARNSADGNGNWTPASAHRYFAGGPGGLFRFVPGGLGAARGTGSAPGLEDIIRDGGVGTAGIGWSPDGRKLFAGTEKGIFEFKLNTQDRMQCPILEMR